MCLSPITSADGCTSAAAAAAGGGGTSDASYLPLMYLPIFAVVTLAGACAWCRWHSKNAPLHVRPPSYQWGVAPACEAGEGAGAGGEGGGERGVVVSEKCPLCVGAGCASLPSDCSVCLSAFEAPQEVRQLPCKHLYHKECIDKWLDSGKETCPLCAACAWQPQKQSFFNSFFNFRSPWQGEGGPPAAAEGSVTRSAASRRHVSIGRTIEAALRAPTSTAGLPI
ncbi:hypothetical protein JKP88DRAFT_329024 [Tribonema minus]|uniref:RING-type domain-containing protein n=1 Tax=Tribonema minus TaxID=303371 RepID=A0A835YWR1_9STRA|nr:hypothetical protein JKP88DRAFT_329024 [Tribonema minus]